MWPQQRRLCREIALAALGGIEDRRACDEVHRLVGLKSAAHKKPAELSGGMTQRVDTAIAA